MIASFVRPIRTRIFSPSVVLSSSCPLGLLAVQRRSLSQTRTTRHSRAGKRSHTFGPCMSTTVSDREVSQQLSKSLEIDTSLSCHLIDFVSCLARLKLYRAPCYRITFGYMFGYTHTHAQNSHCEFSCGMRLTCKKHSNQNLTGIGWWPEARKFEMVLS